MERSVWRRRLDLFHDILHLERLMASATAKTRSLPTLLAHAGVDEDPKQLKKTISSLASTSSSYVGASLVGNSPAFTQGARAHLAPIINPKTLSQSQSNPSLVPPTWTLV